MKLDKIKDKVFHVISNTHWDREWRFPFQRNRQMLVEMIDSLLDILIKEPDYHAFHLDSQTVVLEDYLEIKPHKRPLLEKLISEGRILVGPWYILPEEFQVGGESLVRNLLLGHKIAAQFGHVMKVGYSPFSWGQISQLPQIYKEFGIEVVMFYRGVNSLDSEKAEFMWQGADGTRLLTSRFSTMPRYNFYFYIYRPVVHNENIPDTEYKWIKGGLPFHFADGNLVEEDYNLLQPTDEYHAENLRPAVEAILEKQLSDFTTPHIFWAEGHDSSGPNAKTVRLVRDIKKLLKNSKVEHNTLEDYAMGLVAGADYKNLPVVKGERRSSQYDNRSGNMYGYTTSARMYLKQLNFDVERWLQFYAEPFNSIAALLGADAQDRYLEIAWRYQLQNSAHDSIGGCSLDSVHKDVESRYKQSLEIAKGVFARAGKRIVQNIDLKKYEPESIHLIVLNPNSNLRDEIVEAFLDIPIELDQQSIRVLDSDNHEIDLQIIAKQKSEPVLEQMIDRPMFLSMQRYHCFMDVQNIPAFGYKSLHIQPSKMKNTSTNKLVWMRNELPIMENDMLRIEVNNNGSLNVLDKRTGRQFKDLAYFFDEGEAGHAWVHEALHPVYNTLNSAAEIEVLINGPLLACCRIVHHLNLPADLLSRKENKTGTVIKIELMVTLRRNSSLAEFDVKLENLAESHRLRMMFPTGIDAPFSYGEGQFDVVARPTHRPDTSDWLEQPMYDYPMHHFVDVTDGEQGAAILVDGLKEYEFLPDQARTVAITLIRAFNFVIQPSSVQDYSHQKGSQCLGLNTFRLAFYPHSGDWQSGKVYQQALNFNNALRLVQCGRAQGNLPEIISFFTVQPEGLLVSAFKPAEDSQANHFILRLYNPDSERLEGKINFHFNVKAAWQVTLEEKILRHLELNQNETLCITVAAKKIVTLKVELSV